MYIYIYIIYLYYIYTKHISYIHFPRQKMALLGVCQEAWCPPPAPRGDEFHAPEFLQGLATEGMATFGASKMRI